MNVFSEELTEGGEHLPKIKKTCTWKQLSRDFDIKQEYKTDCGMEPWHLGPNYIFCPYCSNKIIRE